MKRIYLILTLFLLPIFSLMAQQDLMLSQEIFSRVNKNPAATGNTNDVDIFLHGRLQWLGLSNGPKTTVLNVTNYIDKIKSGVGFTMSYDHIGIGHNTTNIKLVYSYQIDLSDHYILSMGLGGGVNVGGFDYTANTMTDIAEYGMDTYPYEKEVKVTPDFDFGIEVSHLKWTLGASMTHLFNKESTTFKAGRHLYIYGTSLLQLNDRLDIAPTVAYMHHNKTNTIELGSLLFYNRLIWGGITWRPDFHDKMNPSMLVFTAGLEWHKFRFGYSFDLGLGSDNTLPSNTHEIILSYGIAKRNKK